MNTNQNQLKYRSYISTVRSLYEKPIAQTSTALILTLLTIAFFGLAAIKGVGQAAIEGINKARGSGMGWEDIKQAISSEQTPEAESIRDIREGDGMVILDLEGTEVEIDFTKSVEENAARFYEDAKWAKKKMEGLGEASRDFEDKLVKAEEKEEKVIREDFKEMLFPREKPQREDADGKAPGDAEPRPSGALADGRVDGGGVRVVRVRPADVGADLQAARIIYLLLKKEPEKSKRKQEINDSIEKSTKLFLPVEFVSLLSPGSPVALRDSYFEIDPKYYR